MFQIMLWILSFYLVPLALTLLLEGGAALLFRFQIHERRALLLINLITNPMLNLLLLCFYYLTSKAAPLYLILMLEALIILAEALLMKRFTKERGRPSYAVPMLAINLISFMGGMILLQALPMP